MSQPSVESSDSCEIAVIGAGRIGSAILTGLTRKGWPVTRLAYVTRTGRTSPRLSDLGVAQVSVADAAHADVVVIAVKPADVPDVVRSISPMLRSDPTVVSVAAGVSLNSLERLLPSRSVVVRAIPNTAAEVGESMTALCAGTQIDNSELARVESVLAPLGTTVWVSEDQLDAITSLAGSGPAFVYYLAEAMIESGITAGLDPSLSRELVIQTVIGATAMVRKPDSDPAHLLGDVTSPQGTTSAAVQVLNDRCVRAAVNEAVLAARDRARELPSCT